MPYLFINIERPVADAGTYPRTTRYSRVLDRFIGRDGLLRKNMESIMDELAIYRGIYTTEEELNKI